VDSYGASHCIIFFIEKMDSIKKLQSTDRKQSLTITFVAITRLL
jgi:hypothetical protein